MIQVRSYRIVHLSDLHLTATNEASRSEPRLFGRLTGMNERFRQLLASELVQSADRVLVTGDVTDRGDLASWHVFWDAVQAAGLYRKVLVLPGNHDVCNLGAPRIGPRTHLRKADLVRAAKGLKLGHQPTRFPWGKVLVPKDIAVIGIDSNNAGNWTPVDNAVGQIGFHQLEALARLLRRKEIAACPVKILALHHSPNLPKHRRGAHEYSALDRWGHEVHEGDRQSLRLLCVLSKVRLVVHGHLHKSDDRVINGIRMIGAPASTQPAGARGRSASTCAVWSYTVKGKSRRVYPELHRVRLQGPRP